MSEYIVDLSKVAVKTTGELDGFDRFMFLQGLPIREEIVRCRDCGKSIGGEQCMRHKSSGWSGNTWVEEYEQVDPDGYCAWGERRDA